MTLKSAKEEKVMGFIPYNVYRWILCFTVMSVLVPMAGTMTSFGAIKDAVTTTTTCNISAPSYTVNEKTNEVNCSADDMIEIDEWKARGYENVNKKILSLVGSLVFGFTVGASFLTSPLIAKLGYRKTGLTGVTTGIIALVATMFATNFYMWFITYSVLFGLSNNLLYNTGMQMCNAFFPTDYNTAATVIASFGISLGTMVMNPLSVYLVDNFGWRYRFAACAAILGVLGYPCCLFWSQPRELTESEEKEPENMTEKADLVQKEKAETEMYNPADTINLFTSVVFWCWNFGTTFWSLCFVIPLDFAIGFMTENGISRGNAGFVMTALGVSELVSRFLCAVTGEQKKISKPAIYIISSIVGAASCVLPIIGYNSKGDEGLSLPLMYVYAIVVGFCAGVLNCLIMACTVDIFGQRRTVEVWNYVNLMLGIGFVGGPFIGAWFTEDVVPDLVYVFYLAIAFFALCALIMAPIPKMMGALQPRPVNEMESGVELNANNNNREDAAMIVRQ